ncbi:MAG: hypothetical protein COA69_13210 [Robiginitomaculum sp.]|nr:MAG: hypothetical protein COA69_13210 [Robiginitomaculum sp.]
MAFPHPRQFLHEQRARLHERYVHGAFSQFWFEFIVFGLKQAWACLFGGLMLCVLLGTYLYYPQTASLARYDFITLMAILIQFVLLATRLETFEEARIILVFHIVGTLMELFKTQVGSWVYPEASLLRILDVPLFTGFMYACVGSYIARVWRIFDFRFQRFPPLKWQALLAVLIYANFFTHHYIMDVRGVLFVASVVLYAPCMLRYKPDEKHRPMPLIIGLFLVALFIWFAENIGTFTRTWSYPGQSGQWHMVSPAKLGSWYLLMLISFVLVSWIHRPIQKWRGVES